VHRQVLPFVAFYGWFGFQDQKRVFSFMIH
jgi:hypothetical protein